MNLFIYKLISTNSLVNCFIPFSIFLPPQLGCGAAINLATFKDHASECKLKLAKVCMTLCTRGIYIYIRWMTRMVSM